MQKGIVAILAKATNGIGVILEHRYYGDSFPVANLTTENLRFLTTDQALADSDYFARNVVFEGVDVDVRAGQGNAAWIAYGGSYAGAFVAFLRKLYPDTFWGAISSSGVTEAIIDYWAYFDAVTDFAPELCVRTTQELVTAIDKILIDNADSEWPSKLKAAFGLEGITHNDDFAAVLSFGIQGWQGLNWDPKLNNTDMGAYCDDISTRDTLRYPELEDMRSKMQEVMDFAGHPDLVNPSLNYIGWLRETYGDCSVERQDSCFGTHNASYYYDVSLENQGGKSWAYQ